MDLITADIQKVLISVVLGAVIGLEREWSGKPAGFRTLMLVSAGATVFSLVSIQMAGLDTHGVSDITRIASNIVSGIGFIGAGIIFMGKGGVQGLTTAATVWVTAAIGMAVGVGNYHMAVGTTIIVWLILVVLHRVEWLFLKMGETIKYKLVLSDKVRTSKQGYYEMFFRENKCKIIDTTFEKDADVIVFHLHVRASQKHHRQAIEQMLADDNIVKLTYS